MRGIFSGLVVLILLVGALTLAFNIQPVRASGTIYIRADGSIDPITAPITTVDNVTYTFAANIYDSIVVERDNIVVDGSGSTLQGTGGDAAGIGISFQRRNNATIRSARIASFVIGIYLYYSSNITITENDIENNFNDGVRVDYSNNITIAENNIAGNNLYGVEFAYPSYENNVVGNNIANNSFGGIVFFGSSNNNIVGNNLTRNGVGINLSIRDLIESSNNIIYHNTLIDNAHQVDSWPGFKNLWDNGYPSGGNYWSDYAGADANHDGIGDTPYIIDVDNIDNYPLMTPYIANAPVGVKAGDWIKYDYTFTGWPTGTPYPEWLKVEFLSVEGTSLMVRVTMHISDGTEQNATVPLDVVAGGQALGLSGFVIPANLTTGDVVCLESGAGESSRVLVIAGELTGIYAGAARIVLYAKGVLARFSEPTYYWDKRTGVMVEATATSGGITGTAKATETNMWQPEPIGPFYIRADGSVDPPTAPISSTDNTTYVLTGSFFSVADGIVVERDNIVLDGSGFAVVGMRADFSCGINLSETNNVTIQNTDITNFYLGILLNSSSNNSINGNNLAHNSGYGIGLAYSSNNSISRNAVTDNQYDGVELYYSSINNVSGNTIANNQYEGIGLSESSNNSISGNTITDNSDGIWLISSSNNSLIGNAITNNDRCGIWLISSSNNDVGGNTFIGGGLAVRDSYMNSVENNTVNGRPLAYLEGVADYRVDDAGQVVLVRCDRIRVEDLNLSRTFIGVELCETTNSIVSQNNIMTNNYGIWLLSSSNNSISGNAMTENGLNAWCIELENSSNNSISGNSITNNDASGIWLSSSSNNSIRGNNITDNNGDGIGLGSSSNNSLNENTITNNVVGIGIYSSSNNSINKNHIAYNRYTGIELGYDASDNTLCHNNFINNTNQVYFYSNSANAWDDGYPSGGNFWSGYNGTDLYCGLGQNETGSDGIGDAPYIIDISNVDHYPFVNPLVIPPTTLAGDVNGDGNVSLADLTSLALAYNSKLGDSNWNPMADLAAPYGIIGLTDVVTLATHYGQHNP
jgi:parallel beta-helix repeat protein